MVQVIECLSSSQVLGSELSATTRKKERIENIFLILRDRNQIVIEWAQKHCNMRENMGLIGLPLFDR